MGKSAITILVGVICMVAAVFFGSEIATENYSALLISSLVAGIFLYIKSLYKQAFIILVILVYSGTSITLPFGSIRSLHIAVMLFTLTFGYDYLLHPAQALKVKEYKKGGVFCLMAICAIGFLYLYQIVNPISPYEFSSKQTLKALLEALAPFLVILAYYIKNDATVFKVRSTRQFYLVLSGILLCHIVYRVYLISVGALDEGPDANDVGHSVFGPISISSYTLRSIGPLGALTGVCSFLHWNAKSGGVKNRFSMQLISLTLGSLGVLGALLGSGRGSLIVTFLGGIIALVYYRKFVVLFLVGTGLFLMFVILNLFASEVQHKLPDAMSRSITLFIIGDESAAAESVSSSTGWREELGEMAYEEWVSDPDIFIRGRGVYNYTEFDQLSIQVYGGYEAQMYSSLKTANPHIRWLSLALRFGVIGVILYYCLYLSVLRKSIALIARLDRRLMSPIYFVSVLLLLLGFPLSLISTAGVSFPILLLLLASRFSIEEECSQNILGEIGDDA